MYYSSNNANLGYIGGFKKAVSEAKLDLSIYDYMIISNVDVEMTPSFLNLLANKRYAKWKLYFFVAL